MSYFNAFLAGSIYDSHSYKTLCYLEHLASNVEHSMTTTRMILSLPGMFLVLVFETNVDSRTTTASHSIEIHASRTTVNYFSLHLDKDHQRLRALGF